MFSGQSDRLSTRHLTVDDRILLYTPYLSGMILNILDPSSNLLDA